MNRLLLLAAAAAMAIAGCAESATPKSTAAATTSGAASVVDAGGLDPGAIEGTVTDDLSAPIAGASILLKEPSLELTSDASGTFAFSGIAPGSYSLFAAKVGYESRVKKVEVKAGETASVSIALPAQAAIEGRVDLKILKGIVCGFSLYATHTTFCPHNEANQNNVFNTSVTPDLVTAINEVVWQADTTVGAKALRLWFGQNDGCPNGICDMDPFYQQNVDGVSPIVTRNDAPFPALSDKPAGTVTILYHRIWPPTQQPDPPYVAVITEQPFEIYVSYFYGESAPEGYQARPPE